MNELYQKMALRKAIRSFFYVNTNWLVPRIEYSTTSEKKTDHKMCTSNNGCGMNFLFDKFVCVLKELGGDDYHTGCAVANLNIK